MYMNDMTWFRQVKIDPCDILCHLFLSVIVLAHSLIHHFETIPNSNKLQKTNEIWLLKDLKIQIA